MKTLILFAGILMMGQQPVQHKPISTAWDVPAVMYTTPASYPCNHVWPVGATAVPAVCITEEEMHWKCADSARVLLTSEGGVHHCILFPPQETETVRVKSDAPEHKEK